MSVSLSEFAQNITVETAFSVLAVAKKLAAGGKEVIELEIGDSPFASTPAAKEGGLQAIRDDQTHYCPSGGLPAFREAVSEFVNHEYGLSTTAANIVAGPGAKVFELLFCETFLDPGDGVVRRLEFLTELEVSILSQRRGPYPPYGLFGGEPGALGRNTLHRADGTQEQLPGKAQFTARAGDVLSIETPGGGGFGGRRASGSQ